MSSGLRRTTGGGSCGWLRSGECPGMSFSSAERPTPKTQVETGLCWCFRQRYEVPGAGPLERPWPDRLGTMRTQIPAVVWQRQPRQASAVGGGDSWRCSAPPPTGAPTQSAACRAPRCAHPLQGFGAGGGGGDTRLAKANRTSPLACSLRKLVGQSSSLRFVGWRELKNIFLATSSCVSFHTFPP